MAAMNQQMDVAMQQVSPPAAPSGLPGAADAPSRLDAPGVTPEMKQMMLNNAKMAVSAAPNDQMRQMIIEQYRLAGIPIDEKGDPL